MPMQTDVTTSDAERHARSRILFEQLRATGDAQAREELVRLHLPLAHHLARRFAGRGEPLDDLVQVASVALVKAIDRFDVGRDVEFATFAAPTIIGELKRHFRDACWAIRVSRRMQENHLALRATAAALTQELGRAPTTPELADAAGLTPEDVVETLEAAQAYRTESLDLPSGTGEDAPPRGELVGGHDERLALCVELEALAPAIRRLDDRDRRILYLRFFRGQTQQEIADAIGISQMHVSRLLTRTLARLRSSAPRELAPRA